MARCGPSTTGCAGAVCAPPATRRLPSRSVRAYAGRSSALGDHPELYAVTRQGELGRIPIANRVQAWTVGAMHAFDHDWGGRVR